MCYRFQVQSGFSLIFLHDRKDDGVHERRGGIIKV